VPRLSKPSHKSPRHERNASEKIESISSMTTLLYLLAGILTAPGALFAFYFWSVMGLARQQGWYEALRFLYHYFVRMMDWGIWVFIVTVIVWIAFAFMPKYRFVGAAFMGLVAIASVIEYFIAMGFPKIGDLFLPLLSVAGLFLNMWIIWNRFQPTSANG
jgi:hypothetical protein